MNRIRSIGRLGLLAAWALAAATLRTAPAAITVQDGVPWVYEVHDGGATILHGPGCGDVTIPAQLDCYPVTRLGANAFSGCTGLTGMTLPGSVTSIGDNAFSGCTGLATLCVPVGFEGATQVADWGVPSSCTVLYGDAWEKVDGSAWSYVVHDGSATVTAGPREGAITIPSVLGGHPVTGIGSNAFYECYGMTSVTIGDNVTNIGERAFYDCSGLTAVHIHDLAAWCGIEFGDHDANPLYNARHLYLDGEEVAGDLVIPDGVARIGSYAFCFCTNLTSVTIPGSVTNIGDCAFDDCRGLTRVRIGDSVTSIGYSAFCDCSGLASVTIPDSVTRIGEAAFDSCRGLTSVTIPANVTSIEGYAFAYCSGLTNMTVGGSVTNIGRGMVEGDSQLATMNVPEAWRSLYVGGEFWSRYAGVPSGCRIVYYEPASPGLTATGVPYGWLEEKAGEALAAAGGDYEAAAKAAAANGRAVWECYVAGLDPGDAEKDFTTAITFEDGEPKVSWDPDLNAGGKTERVYRAWARKSAAVPEEEEGAPGTGTQDGWRDVTGRESSWSEEGWRFFRVGVELPGGARGAGAVTSEK